MGTGLNTKKGFDVTVAKQVGCCVEVGMGVRRQDVLYLRNGWPPCTLLVAHHTAASRLTAFVVHPTCLYCPTPCLPPHPNPPLLPHPTPAGC